LLDEILSEADMDECTWQARRYNGGLRWFSLDHLDDMWGEEYLEVRAVGLGLGGARKNPAPKPKQRPKQKKGSKSGNVNATMARINNTLERFTMPRSVAARPVPKAKPAATGGLSMSKCAAKFALAVSDPFNIAARGVCIPGDGTPSQKTHAFTRLEVTIGLGGVAAIYVTPCLANNLPTLAYTTSIYDGTTSDALEPFTEGGAYGPGGDSSFGGTTSGFWAAAAVNTPYTAAELSITNQIGDNPICYGKVVSAGLRVQYTGTTLNESGLFKCMHEGSHSSLAGLTPNDMLGYSDTDIRGVDRRPCAMTVFPVNDMEVHYFNAQGHTTSGTNTVNTCQSLYPFSRGTAFWSVQAASSTQFAAAFGPVGDSYNYYPVGVPVGLFTVTGVPGQTVHVEYIQHMEYGGELAGPMATPTEPDIEAAKRVQSAALSVPAAKLAFPNKSNWQIMFEELKRAYKVAKPILVPAAEMALMALVG